MTKFESEACELNIGELDAVVGGSMLGMAIAAYEKYMAGLGGRLIDAVHQPLTSKPGISLHMR